MWLLWSFDLSTSQASKSGKQTIDDSAIQAKYREGEKSYSEKAREENSWPFKSPLRLLLWQLCGFLTMSFPSGLMSLTTHKTWRIELPSMPDIWTVSWGTFTKLYRTDKSSSSIKRASTLMCVSTIKIHYFLSYPFQVVSCATLLDEDVFCSFMGFVNPLRLGGHFAQWCEENASLTTVYENHLKRSHS